MLPPDISPVHQLVSQWWTAHLRPSARAIQAMHLELSEAALAELRANASLNNHYDPFSDARLLWASQYLNNALHSGYRINPDIKARASWLIAPPLYSICGKDRAAGAA